MPPATARLNEGQFLDAVFLLTVGSFLLTVELLVARAIRSAIRANQFARIIRKSNPYFIARQADSHASLEFPIRANRLIRANRANRIRANHATVSKEALLL